MKKDNTGLEDFVGRHRADFDAFEPRPDLWDSIERELNAAPTPAAEPAPLRVVPLHPTAPAAPRLRTAAARRRRYGVAAALVVLLLAGLGGRWYQTRPTGSWARTGTATVLTPAPELPADAAAGLGTEPMTAAAGQAPTQRATAAVQRMETYYAAQLRERQAELTQLDARLGTAPADWQRELRTLDSTYQQLKVELARNPEPDVVLDAMNRNLQIRLDILNQQLRTRAQVQQYAETEPQP